MSAKRVARRPMASRQEIFELMAALPDSDDETGPVSNDPVPSVLCPTARCLHPVDSMPQNDFNPRMRDVKQGAEVEEWLEKNCSASDLRDPVLAIERRGGNAVACINWMSFEAQQRDDLDRLIRLQEIAPLNDVQISCYTRLINWFRARPFARKSVLIERHMSTL